MLARPGEAQMLSLRSCYSRSLSRAMRWMRGESPISPISVATLASLSDRAGERLILFDLRDLREIERNGFSIPGALLTFNIDLRAMVRWIPRDSTVVLFAEETIPPHDTRLRIPSRKLDMFALEGGLQLWWKTGLPLEPVALSDRKWVDNR
jgi:hypothetical protein